MKKSATSKHKRSIAVTIIATLIAAIVAFVTILILPITNFVECMAFIIGVLIFIVAAITAIDGKPGSIKELIFTLGYWSR